MTRGTRRLVLTALFVALVTVATIIIRVPLASTGGYLNVGDTMIFIAAALLGPQAALVAGGLGSFLADLLGYPPWALWTLVIKGIEGLIAGVLIHRAYSATRTVNVRVVIGLVVAAAWMVLGYFISYVVVTGLEPALASTPFDVVQGAASVILASILLVALRRLDVEF